MYKDMLIKMFMSFARSFAKNVTLWSAPIPRTTACCEVVLDLKPSDEAKFESSYKNKTTRLEVV